MASHSAELVNAAIENLLADETLTKVDVQNLISSVHHLSHFPMRATFLAALLESGDLEQLGKKLVSMFAESYKASLSKPMVRRYLDFRVDLNFEKSPTYFFEVFANDPKILGLLKEKNITMDRNEMSVVYHAIAADVFDRCQRAVVFFFRQNANHDLATFAQYAQDDVGILLLSGFALHKVIMKLEDVVDDRYSDQLMCLAKILRVAEQDTTSVMSLLTEEERCYVSERSQGGLTFLDPAFLPIFHSINEVITREMVYESFGVYGRTVIEKTKNRVDVVKKTSYELFRETANEVCNTKGKQAFTHEVTDDLFGRLCDRFVNTRIDDSFVVVREIVAAASGRKLRGGQSLRDRLFAMQ